MPQLFPTFEVPSTVPPSRFAKPAYPKSFLFNFNTLDFARDGQGRFVEIDGHAAWVQWCQMAVLTTRFAHVIYSRNYGLTPSKESSNRAQTQSYYEREITDTLKADPRTQTVRGFSFEWQGDQLYIKFTVVPVVGEAQRLEVRA